MTVRQTIKNSWLIYINGALGRSRTCDLPLRRRSLYPLSYQGKLTGINNGLVRVEITPDCIT